MCQGKQYQVTKYKHGEESKTKLLVYTVFNINWSANTVMLKPNTLIKFRLDRHSSYRNINVSPAPVSTIAFWIFLVGA